MLVYTQLLSSLAQAAPQMNYQGKLTDNLGATVADGTYNVRFRLYASPATTTTLWSETASTTVTNGLFSYMLGSTSPLTGVNFNQPLYLGVEIGGTGAPSWDGEMTPRKILGTVPAAFEARRLNGLASSSFLRSDQADTAANLLTFTSGLVSQSSSTITGLTTLSATTTNFIINGERFTDLTGTGLTISGTALTVATTTLGLGDGTLGGLSDVTTTGALSGNLLSYTGSGWATTSTSTLGLGDGSFIGLSDTQGSLTANRLIFASSSGAALTDSANLTFDGTDLNLGVSNGLAFGGTRFVYASSTNRSILFGDNLGATYSSNVDSIFLGYAAGNSGAANNTDSIFIGRSAGFNAGYNTDSIFIGRSAGQDAYFQSDNIFIGFRSGSEGGAESENVAIGSESARYLVGSGTVAIGHRAGIYTNGNYNSFLGHQAAENLNNGSSSVAIGASALYSPTFADAGNLTAIGYRAGYNIETGADNNILLGYQAADSLTTGANNIIIGYDVEAPSNTGDNQLNIGNILFGTGIDGTGTTLSSGNIGIGTTSPSSKLDVWGDFRVGTSSTPTLFTDVSTGRVGIGTSTPGSLLTLVAQDTADIINMYNTNGSSTFRVEDNGQVNIGEKNVVSPTLGLLRITRSQVGSPNYSVDADVIIEDNDNPATLAFMTSDNPEAKIVFGDASSDGETGAIRYSHSNLGEYMSFDVLDSERVRITGAGNVGIGTTSPSSKLTVAGNGWFGGNLTATGTLTLLGTGTSTSAGSFDIAGNLALAGALYDSTDSPGSNGFVLQSTGTSTQWVATSSLGLSTQSLNLGADNQIPFMNGTTDFEYSSGLTYNGSVLGLGAGQGLAIGGATVFQANPTQRSIAIGDGTLSSGLENIGIGWGSLSGSGTYNIKIGRNSLISNTSGSQNTSLGNYALLGNTSGSRNTALGMYALQGNSTGWYNVGVGRSALYNNQSGTGTVAVGYEAGYGAGGNSNAYNTFLGYQAGRSVTTGDNNIFIGSGAGYNLTTGANNIVLGYEIDLQDPTQSNQLNIGNLIFGTGIDGTGTTLSSGNIGIGTTSPSSKLTVAGNTYIGGTLTATGTLALLGTGTSTSAGSFDIAGNMALAGALYDSTDSAGSNGFVLQSTGTSTQWVATSSLGIGGGASVTFGTDNQIPFMNSGDTDFEYTNDLTYDGSKLFVGGNIDMASTSEYLFAGETLLKLIDGPNFAYDNLFVGAAPSSADETDITGNTGVGRAALLQLTAGDWNTGLGYQTMSNLTNSSRNTALGGRALQDITAGDDDNTAVGYYALKNMVSGINNTYLGSEAGRFVSTSSNSVVIGSNAVRTSGAVTLDNLTVLGTGAGESLTDGGNNNVLLGFAAADNLTTGANNIVLGYDVDIASTTGSNQLNIGNLIFGTGIDGTGTTLSSGNIGIGTSSPSSKLTVAGDTYIGGNLRATGTITFDALASPSSDGLLITNASGVVSTTSTSTLGLGDGSFIGLSDTQGSLTANRLIFTNSGGSALTDNTTLTFDGTTFSAPTTTLSGLLTLSGSAANIALGSNWLSGDGGDEGIFVDGSGNVGVGTSSLNTRLTVSGTSTFKGNVSIGEDRSLNSDAAFHIGDASDRVNFSVEALGIASKPAFVIRTPSSGGKIFQGIRSGAGSADLSFQIDNSGETGLFLGAGGARDVKFVRGSAGELLLATNELDRMIIDSSGQVGIGTTSPSSKLDVWGDFRVGTSSDALALFGTAANTVTFGTTTPGTSARRTAFALNNVKQTFVPSSPIGVGSITDGVGGADELDGATDIAVVGNYAYVTGNSDHGVQILDISDPTNPTAVGSITEGARGADELVGAHGIAVVGDYAYIAADSDDGVQILDISDPTNPVGVGSIGDGANGADVLDGATDIAIAGNYAYIATDGNSDNGVQILDISDPTNPIGIGSIEDGAGGADELNGATSITVVGDYAYIASWVDDGVQILDISDPTNPVGVGSIDDLDAGGPYELDGAFSITVAGNYAYVAASVDDGVQILDISDPTNPVGVGSITDGSNGADELDGATSITVTGNYAYVAANSDNGVQILDISSSTNPVGVGSIGDGSNGADVLDNAQNIVVAGNYAYVASASFDDGVQILDLGGLETPTAEIGNLLTTILATDRARVNQLLTVDGSANIGQDALIGGALTITGSASSSLLAGNANPALIVRSGNVGLGTIDPQVALHIGSTTVTDSTNLLRLEDTNSTCNFNADTGTPSCGSDASLKQDIARITDSLSTITQLQPSLYRWKTESRGDPLQSGFIAQEVQQVLPSLVATSTWVDGSERLFLNTGAMMPYVVGAIGEQNSALRELLETGSTSVATGLFARVQGGANDTVWERLVALAEGFVDGILKVAGIESEQVNTNQLTTDRICVGEVCVSEAEFAEVFGAEQAQESETGATSNDSTTVAPSSTADDNNTNDTDGVDNATTSGSAIAGEAGTSSTETTPLASTSNFATNSSLTASTSDANVDGSDPSEDISDTTEPIVTTSSDPEAELEPSVTPEDRVGSDESAPTVPDTNESVEMTEPATTESSSPAPGIDPNDVNDTTTNDSVTSND